MSWYEQARERLEREDGQVKGPKEIAMKEPVREALLEFCRQNEEFAQAVAQGGSFADCMTAVASRVGRSISDLEAYLKAVRYYFDGAYVEYAMTIRLEPADTARDRDSIVLDLADFF